MSTLYTTDGSLVAVYRTDGTMVWGSPDGANPSEPAPPAEPPKPPEGPLMNVATRMAAANNGAGPEGGASGTMAATRHLLAVDVDTVTVSWSSTYGYGFDTSGTYRAAVAVNDGPVVPVTVDGGQQTWRITKPLSTTPTVTTSDPVRVPAYAGDTITVYVWAVPDEAGKSISSDLIRRTPGDLYGTGDWGSALAGLKPLTQYQSLGWAYRPARIVSTSNLSSWLGVGDSIIQGNWSYVDQALDMRGLPGVKSAQGGEAHRYFPGRWNERCAPHVPTAPYMIDQYGVNSPGKMPTAGLGFWNHAKANGVTYLVKTTIAPTTSQGSPTMNHADAQKDNAWLRDGAPLTADKTTALPTGTTDATAVRCDVIRPDGTIKKGTGGHLIDAVSDTAARIEASPGYLSDEAAAVIGGDKLHPSAAVHAMLAERLARDLEILGF